jgi:hypothetical protein
MAILNFLSVLAAVVFFWAFFKYMIVPAQNEKAQRRANARKK